jgi:AcrR family transcriptional regulator
VRANQRDRLFAATIALVAEHGYEATTLVAISQLSGVSRGTFYEHFADKRECVLAAVDAMVALALAEVETAYWSAGADEVRFRRAFERLAELMIAQPAAARVWFVETYALGDAGVERHDRASSAISALVRRGLNEGAGLDGELPEEIEEAIVGGLRWVL